MDSPAEIIRSCLIDLGLVIMPGIPNQTIPYQQTAGDGSILCYVSSMPDDEDQCICIYDQSGIVWGRDTSKKLAHPGIKVLVRAVDYSIGSLMVRSLALAIDNRMRNITTVLNGTPYTISNFYRTGTIISLGEEVGKRRQLWSINARVAFDYSTPLLG